MVVDPGVHVFAWSRDSAISNLKHGGWPEAEAMADRIVVWPGQLTAYDTGALEILALREQVRRELGERFDIREFHDQAPEHGAGSQVIADGWRVASIARWTGIALLLALGATGLHATAGQVEDAATPGPKLMTLAQLATDSSARSQREPSWPDIAGAEACCGAGPGSTA